MRFPTHTFLIAATVATTLAMGEPVFALTADEKREQSRLLKAQGVSLRRRVSCAAFRVRGEMRGCI